MCETEPEVCGLGPMKEDDSFAFLAGFLLYRPGPVSEVPADTMEPVYPGTSAFWSFATKRRRGRPVSWQVREIRYNPAGART